MRKPVFSVSDQVPHKPGCTVEGLDYLCSENKGADQLRGYREADLRLCFRICKKPVFGSYFKCQDSAIEVIFWVAILYG